MSDYSDYEEERRIPPSVGFADALPQPRVCEHSMAELDSLAENVIQMMRKQERRVNIPRCMAILQRVQYAAINEDPLEDNHFLIDVSEFGGMTKADVQWLRLKSPRFRYNPETKTLRVQVDN